MTDKARLHYSWTILAVGTLVVFGALGLARFGYTPVLPAMQKGLSLNNTQAGLLATANLLGYLLLSALGGALASHYGPRRVITAGLFLTAASMLLTGLAGGFLTAALWRCLTGIGSGASNVPVMGLLSAWFSPKRRGLATGIAVSGSSLGLIFIGPLVPRLLALYGEKGWRACWFTYSLATFVIVLAAFFLLRDRPEDQGLKPFGLRPGESVEDHGRKRKWRHVYVSTSVWHLGMVYVAFGFSYIIYITFFTKHLTAAGGYTAEEAGRLLMIIGWLSIFCGLIWGMVSDFIGRRLALVMVYAIQALSFILFALWTEPAGLIASAVLFGLSAWSIPAIMAAACGDLLGSRMAPAALGFITLFFGIGQALGPSVAGILADRLGSFHSAFFLAGVVAFAGAIGSWKIRLQPEGQG